MDYGLRLCQLRYLFLKKKNKKISAKMEFFCWIIFPLQTFMSVVYSDITVKEGSLTQPNTNLPVLESYHG